jgi:hypothetical protein
MYVEGNLRPIILASFEIASGRKVDGGGWRRAAGKEAARLGVRAGRAAHSSY